MNQVCVWFHIGQGLWFRIKFRVSIKYWADGIYFGCLGSGYDYGSGLGVPWGVCLDIRIGFDVWF